MPRAYREFAQLPGGRYADFAYEHVLADTRSALTTAAEFLELPDDEGWIDRAMALVNGKLKPRAPLLAPEERAPLEAACLPGQIPDRPR